MVSLNDLEFAQMFPSSETAKRVIRELDVPISEASERVKKRAIARLRAAFNKKPYIMQRTQSYKDRDLMEAEVLSFPLAKVYLSVINNSKLFGLFAKSNADAAFQALEEERGEEQKIRLAQEFGLEFDLVNEGTYSLSVVDFLSIKPWYENMKLVNQSIEKGRVYLNEERFTRFLSSKVFRQIIESLPVSLKGVPDSVKRNAMILGEEFTEKQRKKFKKLSTKVKPELFPPCMEKLYADLLEGKNLPHLARFDLVAFLNAVGMPQEQIIKAFSNALNYKEKITRYQVKKITQGGRKGKGYSPASCEKIMAHGFCTGECNVKHPTQYYRGELYEKKKSGKGK